MMPFGQFAVWGASRHLFKTVWCFCTHVLRLCGGKEDDEVHGWVSGLLSLLMTLLLLLSLWIKNWYKFDDHTQKDGDGDGDWNWKWENGK